MAGESITAIASQLTGLFLLLQDNSFDPVPISPPAKEWLSRLSKGQFFALDKKVYDAAFNLTETWQSDIASGLVETEDLLIFPGQAKLPSEFTFLHVPSVASDALVCLVQQEERVYCWVLAPTAKPLAIGSFVPGGNANLTDFDSIASSRRVGSLLCFVAMTLVLINEPRFTVRTSAASRQVGRAVARGGHLANDCWHLVTWKIDRPADRKATEGGGWKCAYHWKRAHWRKAESHWANVTWLPASSVSDRPAGFYQRIPESYPGDPRLGIVKSIHAPTLSAFFKPKAR